MIVPSLSVVALLAFGVDDIGDLLGIQHAAMLPSMLAVMLLRRQEYSHRTQPLRHSRPVTSAEYAER